MNTLSYKRIAYLLLANRLEAVPQTNRFPGKDCFSDVMLKHIAQMACATTAATYTMLAALQPLTYRHHWMIAIMVIHVFGAIHAFWAIHVFYWYLARVLTG
jgi:hypothetical protein